MNIDEEKIIKSGNRLGWIVLIIIAIVVLFYIIVILNIYKIFTSPIPRKYFILDITDNNKEEVIKILDNEKKNIFGTENYCDSIYKIEYYNSFSDGTDYTMYCRYEDNISFDIDKIGVDNLAKYIRENGYTEKR